MKAQPKRHAQSGEPPINDVPFQKKPYVLDHVTGELRAARPSDH